MALKYFLFAFVAIFAIQGAVESKAVQTYETYGLGEVITEIIKKIVEIINEAIASAIQQLQDAIKQIIDIGQQAINDALAKVTEKINKILEDIKHMKEEAEKLGVNIEECVGNFEEELKELPGQIVGDLKSCVDDKIAGAQAIIDETLNTIKSSLQEVDDLQTRFSECNGDIVCLAQVVKDASVLVSELPGKMKKHIEEALNYIKVASGEMKVCITDKISKALNEINTLFYDISECVHNKLEEEKTKQLYLEKYIL